MKTPTRFPALIRAFAAALFLITAGRLTAQPFTTLHTFNGVGGSKPECGLTLSGRTLYGVTSEGGSNGVGVVFSVNTDGTGFQNLYDFTNGADGAYPYCRDHLLLSGNLLYGVTANGGTNGAGSIFALNTNGTGLIPLHSFNTTDGATPYGAPILSGNTLYGTAAAGGLGHGIIYALNTDGTGFTNLYTFTGGGDGGGPYYGVVQSGGTLFGIAQSGGTNNAGVVFSLGTNGTGFTVLHSFTNTVDGLAPSSLTLSGNLLYGVTLSGGPYGHGTAFALNTDGTGFTLLHRFTGGADGGNPISSFVVFGNTLYGVASAGGGGNGNIYAVNTDGSGFTNLYNFTGSPNGSTPYSGLLLSGNSLYGTTYAGGTNGIGTVYSLALPTPPLAITTLSGSPVLLYPATATNFILQVTTNLLSGNWTAVTSGIPFTGILVTNAAPNSFFRLSPQ